MEVAVAEKSKELEDNLQQKGCEKYGIFVENIFVGVISGIYWRWIHIYTGKK